MIANSDKKLKIAVTGGIASGKSTVMGIIKRLGYKVYSADSIYADLLNEPSFALACSKMLGIATINISGKVTFDRKVAAEKVFGFVDNRINKQRT